MPGIRRIGGVQMFGRTLSGGAPSTPPDVRADVAGFRVDFDRDLFTQLVKTKGYLVSWEKAAYCPYRGGIDPRDHDVSCPVCEEGFIYYESRETRVLLQSIKMEEQYYAFGRFDGGTVLVTAYPEFNLGFWDRITVQESSIRFTEVLMRQPGTVRDKPKYPVLAVENLVWADRQQQLVTYTQDAEFSLDADTGEVVWTSNRPDDRSYYSISYTYRPRYVIIDLLHQIRDTQIAEDQHVVMPTQAMAQLDFLYRPESQDPRSEDTRQNPFPTRR